MCVDKKSQSELSSEKVQVEQVRKVHPEFARFEKPWGMEQHTWNFLVQASAHLFTFWYFYVNLRGDVKESTFLFEVFYGYVGGLGITIGCHRYWTHKTFKANTPLKIMLMLMQTVAHQYPIHKWCLDHRIHHKYTDTDADPHNSKRGFWFSHIGWLFVPKHPDLQKKLKTFDMPDLDNDPVVRFQSRWYWTLVSIFHMILPICILYNFWNITLMQAIAANFRRYFFSLHCTFSVNSVAHMYGDKPYDKNITPVENALVSLVTVGEGWHNYHHTFPWDYKASEFGWRLNLSTMIIEFFGWLGWASDMKTVSQKMLKERLRRTGDSSHALYNCNDNNDIDNDFDYNTPADVTELMKNSVDKPLWGWDDDRIPDEFRKMTHILRPVDT